MPLTFITGLFSAAVNKSTSLVQLLMMCVIAYNSYVLTNMTTAITTAMHKGTTEYALNVVKHGFRSAINDEGIIVITDKWLKKKHYIQVAALQTLCKEEPNRLIGEVTTPNTALTICRMVE